MKDYLKVCLSKQTIIEKQNNLIIALDSEREQSNRTIQSKDLTIGSLKAQIENLIEKSKRQEIRLDTADQRIQDLMKSLDEKEAVIVGQNKIIKQQKQRINKADKQSTKNHNLKMQTETLKSKVFKLQEEVDTMKECQLCFEPYDQEKHKPSVAKCNHVFCKDCLKKHNHSNNGCPMCRKSYTIRDVRELHLNFVQ